MLITGRGGHLRGALPGRFRAWAARSFLSMRCIGSRNDTSAAGQVPLARYLWFQCRASLHASQATCGVLPQFQEPACALFHIEF